MIENYRTISVLSFFSKMLEKIVANYVLNFLDQHAILYDHLGLEEDTLLVTQILA